MLLAAHVAGSPAVYATIQGAVNAAPAGGVVTVDAGTYPEQVTIGKPLTVDGAQAGVDARTGTRPTATAATESVVTGAVSGGVHSSAFHVLANDVTIDGFTVTGETSQDDQLGAGIVIGPRQSGTHVVNDVVRGNVAGLFLANASVTDAAVVQHDDFASNNNAGDNGGRGIYTDGTISGGDLTNVTIDANTFTDNNGGAGTTGYEAAMAFEAGNPGEQSNVRITNNAITDNGKAVLFFNATGILIQGNTVTGTRDHWSGTLRFEGDVNTVSILYNTVDGNTGPAVAVDSKGMPGNNYSFTVNYNNFYGNNRAYSVPISVAANFDTYLGAFDARYNYWGAASGPSGYGPGAGDEVGGGDMRVSTNQGWEITPGGDMLYAPWSTAPVVQPVAPPAAPTGLTAAAPSTAAVALAWVDAAAGNETGFLVQRSADGGVTWGQVGTTTTAVTAFTDGTVVAGQTYRYRVLAVNAAGPSAPSAAATIAVPTVLPPAAPVGLTATAASASAVTLAWSPGGTTQTGYAVDRSTDGGATFATVAHPTATTYTDAGLAAGTTYTYRVWATNAAGLSAAPSAVASATTPAAGTVTTSLVTLTPTSATVGWGTLQTDASIKGNPITLRGTAYPTGLGAHASSTVTYALAGQYATFAVTAGIDDETAGQGAVDFRVLGDGTVLFDTGVVTGASPAAHVSVSVAGVQVLTLQASPGVAGSIDYDHADWAGPVLTSVATTASHAAKPVARTGTVIGTAGSYASAGNTVAKAVDGNLATYFDGPTANGNWVGLDLGSALSVSQISFAPRAGFAGRMVGGLFQASTSADFSTGVTTLYTVTTPPAVGSLTTVTLASPVAARYFRYLSPAGSYGNIAELAFAG